MHEEQGSDVSSLIIKPRFSNFRPWPFGWLKNDPKSGHQYFATMPSINAAPSTGTASLAIFDDDATFHWRNELDRERVMPF